MQSKVEKPLGNTGYIAMEIPILPFLCEAADQGPPKFAIEETIRLFHLTSDLPRIAIKINYNRDLALEIKCCR